jgi:hypothetical protein
MYRKASRMRLKNYCRSTAEGGGFRPGRLVRARARGRLKSHAGTDEPPRRLPEKRQELCYGCD